MGPREKEKFFEYVNSRLRNKRLELWFAKIAIGIQIKELADPPDFGCAGMILTSCCAC